jgi:ATP diphosphatase
VFGDEDVKAATEVKGLWERVKAEEKAARGAKPDAGVLADVPVALPALARAQKLQAKAGSVGFDWNDPLAVLAKIREETEEVAADVAAGRRDAAAREVGDLLFAAVNLARHLGGDAEGLLREANAKFERRFSAIEQSLAQQGKSPRDSTLAEMDALWDAAKAAEKAAE